MSPPSPREKERMAQAMHREDGTQTSFSREKGEFVTGGPSKLTKQPNGRKTVAHIINLRENHTIRPCH